jgi:hypothetical protein
MPYMGERGSYLDGVCGCGCDGDCGALGAWEGLGFTSTGQQTPTFGDSFVDTFGSPSKVDLSSMMGLVETGLNYVPVIGPIASTALQLFTSVAGSLEHFFKLGSGRREADLITPTQNQVGQFLSQIDIATPKANTLPILQHLYQVTDQAAVQFLNFLTDPRFTDGRASQQAANDILSQINGTCGYHWPDMQPTQFNGCMAFGVAQTGRLGTLAAKIRALGGTIPTGATVQQGAGIFPTLQTSIPGMPMLPQSGTLAPRPVVRASIFPTGSDNTTVMVLGLVAVLFLSRMR